MEHIKEPRAAEGDVVSAESYNRLVDKLERLRWEYDEVAESECDAFDRANLNGRLACVGWCLFLVTLPYCLYSIYLYFTK